MSLELWKSVFDWATIVFIALTVFTGAGALVTGDKLGKRQEKQLHQFESGLTSAKTELERQQERTANADARVASLEQDVANAETEMAKQQTRAATAEKELLELRERIKPRRLTDQQSQDFIAELKKATNPLVLKFGYTVGGGDESFTFLKQLLALFKDAGWNTPDKVEEISDHMDIQVVGVALLVPQPPGTDVRTPAPPTLMQLTPAEATLVSAFSKVGISVQMIRWFPGRSLELVIGSKPNP